MIYAVTEGMAYNADKPETYNGFINISNISSIECCDRIYYRKDT